MAFDPQNDLERSLMQASEDAAQRPQFYQDFLKADLFAIEEGPPRQSGPLALAKGAPVTLMTFNREGHTIVPIFSSLPRMQAFIKKEVNYVAMKTPDFLNMTKGTTLVLNPGSDYGKEFTAAEIASILDGSFWRPTDSYVTQQASKVLIGQPANYPSELVAALGRYFQTAPQVKRAFLAHYFNPERDQKPHTLIAVEVTSDWEEVLSNAGVVTQTVRIPDPPVDFLQITGQAGVEEHFKTVKPFYEKQPA